MEKQTLTHRDLSHFTGDLARFRHWCNRHVIYTPGVRYLAERGGAYWLLDAIASYFGTSRMARAVEADPRLAGLQFWRLVVHADGTALLTARADSDDKPFITQEIPFTDFPLEYVDVWAAFDGVHWTLYLPSEH
jgi:hypothetical protein